MHNERPASLYQTVQTKGRFNPQCSHTRAASSNQRKSRPLVGAGTTDLATVPIFDQERDSSSLHRWWAPIEDRPQPVSVCLLQQSAWAIAAAHHAFALWDRPPAAVAYSARYLGSADALECGATMAARHPPTWVRQQCPPEWWPK